LKEFGSRLPLAWPWRGWKARSRSRGHTETRFVSRSRANQGLGLSPPPPPLLSHTYYERWIPVHCFACYNTQHQSSISLDYLISMASTSASAPTPRKQNTGAKPAPTPRSIQFSSAVQLAIQRAAHKWTYVRNAYPIDYFLCEADDDHLMAWKKKDTRISRSVSHSFAKNKQRAHAASFTPSLPITSPPCPYVVQTFFSILHPFPVVIRLTLACLVPTMVASDDRGRINHALSFILPDCALIPCCD
jgi:hypothetical protein